MISPTRYLIAAVLFAASTLHAQNLLENGDFENPTDPFKGWITDYAFSNNSFYIGNKDHLSVGPDGGRQKVAIFTDAGQGGVKLECRPFVIEPGFKYICNLDIKGGGYRIYFAGYQWAPGVHPHDNPELGELRMIYQSKATIGSSDSWKKETMELPGVNLSQAAIEHLKKIRYLTVYIWMLKAGAVDNVTLTKVSDAVMKF
jgi:hypothetical protein